MSAKGKGAAITRTIKARMTLLDYSPQYMAIKMHVSLRTWHRKMSLPERLTVEDLLKIERILKINLLEVKQ